MSSHQPPHRSAAGPAGGFSPRTPDAPHAAPTATSPAALCGLLAEEDRLRVYAAVVLGAPGLTAIESATGLPARTVAAAVGRLQQGGLLAVADGVLRADVDPKLTAYGILGMINSMHQWYRPGGRYTAAEIGERYAASWIDGLSA